jgi:hypothetical protein
MSGRSVAELTFACFLVAQVVPANPSASPAVILAATPPGAPTPDVPPDGPGGSVPRGNCLKVTGTSSGTPYAYCYYTLQKPYCTTFLSHCNSTPPSGKCSTTNPVPAPPPCL